MKNIKDFKSFNENIDEQEFEDRPAYIDGSNGALIGLKSPEVEAAGKLAFEELEELGVPVTEPRSHSTNPTVLFIIDAEESGAEEWLSPFYGTEIAKRDGWKNPKISNTIEDILKKYNLWSEWVDGATLNVSYL